AATLRTKMEVKPLLHLLFHSMLYITLPCFTIALLLHYYCLTITLLLLPSLPFITSSQPAYYVSSHIS
ncbi:hypothetical protein PP707_07940, partial [Acetobacter pasteurianus]|nr:hypothetical protein [Acetobacter pasteurianus]